MASYLKKLGVGVASVFSGSQIEEEQKDNDFDILETHRLASGRFEAEFLTSPNFQIPCRKLRFQGPTQNIIPRKVISRRTKQRGIIFVVDVSGSMRKEDRMANVKKAIKEFVQPRCNDPNIFFDIVKFNNGASYWSLASDPAEALKQIDDELVATGGTDFAVATDELVTAATYLMYPYPGTEFSVIICSDGRVKPENAAEAHKMWEKFVKEEYVNFFGMPPYVTAVGISKSHDSAVLDGFISSDDSGYYYRALDQQAIYSAFVEAAQNALNREAIKVKYQFPVNVITNVWTGTESRDHELIEANETCDHSLWVGRETSEAFEEKEMMVQVNGHELLVKRRVVTNTHESSFLEAEYYYQMLVDMVGNLRGAQDARSLETVAGVVKAKLDELRAEFARVTRLQRVNGGDDVSRSFSIKHQLISTKLNEYSGKVRTMLNAVGQEEFRTLRQSILATYFEMRK